MCYDLFITKLGKHGGRGPKVTKSIVILLIYYIYKVRLSNKERNAKAWVITGTNQALLVSNNKTLTKVKKETFSNVIQNILQF